MGSSPLAHSPRTCHGRSVRKAPPAKTPEPIKRCDLLPSPMNAGKAGIVHQIIDRHRRATPLAAREQWRLFFETGIFDGRADSAIARLAAGPERDRRTAEVAAIKTIVGSAARTQMLRRQIVGQLQSWVSNRVNEFRNMVEASGLDDRTRHMLHAVNVRQAWYSPGTVTFGTAREVVPDDIHRLARRILKAVTARHRRPSWTGLPVQLDRREATLLPARQAEQGGRVSHWLGIVAAGVGKAEVPLVGTPPFLTRKGPRANTVQISRDQDGVIRFGVVTDVTEACAASRAAYRPKVDTIAVDFGMRQLFALDGGDLVGRGFLAKLADLAQRFGIASEEVDPAYTSQRCSSCGHVHRSNRSGDVFRCRRCGLTLHADINAARNIRQRRSLPAPDEALLRPGENARSLRGRRRTLEALRQDFERRHPEEHRRRRWPGCRSRGSGPAADSYDEPLRFAWDEVRRTA